MAKSKPEYNKNESTGAYSKLGKSRQELFDKTWAAASDATYLANQGGMDQARSAGQYTQSSVVRRDNFGSNPGKGAPGNGGPNLGNYPMSPSMVGPLGSFDRFGNIDKRRMAACMFAVKDFGIMKSIKDLMIDFSCEGFAIDLPNRANQIFLEAYSNAIGLEETISNMLNMLYTTGNVFTWETRATISNEDIRKFRNSRGIDGDFSPTVGSVNLPWKYTILNPLNVEITGSKLDGTFGYAYNIQNTDIDGLDKAGIKRVQNLINPSQDNQGLFPERENSIPPDFKNMLKKDKNGKISSMLLPLSKERLDTIFYHKMQHENYAVPPLYPALEDLDFKRTLRMMDRSAAWAIMHGVTVFKLGNIAEDVIASPEEFAKLGAMLSEPTWGLNLVWNDAIEIQSVYPDLGNQFGEDKYKSVDRDILKSLGISEVIVGGDGGSYANSFLSAKQLLERLEYGRGMIRKWAEEKLKEVCRIMGFRNCNVKVRFGRMSLRDEKAEKELLLKLADRNLISRETLLNSFEESLEIERNRLGEEEKQVDKGVLVEKLTPISVQKDDITEGTTPDGGRPPGTTDIKQKTERDTKPQGASVSEQGFLPFMGVSGDAFDKVESLLTSKYLKAKDVPYYKSLSKEDKKSLDALVMSVFSNVDLNSKVNNDIIMSLTDDQRTKNMDDKIKATVDMQVRDFVNRNFRKPKKDELRTIFVVASAFKHAKV